MFRRFRLAAVVSATVVALGSLSLSATAAPKDAAAKKLDQNAMNNDFLMADFPKAEANLISAVNTCGATGCSPAVKAQILVHLGIVQANQNHNADAEKSFIQAVGLDANVKPEGDFTTPEIQKLFDAAKAKAGTAGASGGATASPTVEPRDEAEVSHSVVTEQVVNTPVPIWVAVPDGMPVGRLLVRYKPFGDSWKKLTLTKKRGGWGGEIPCNDVTTTGKLKYYISVLDKAGDPITTLGTLNKPYITKIKNQLDGDPPHLPQEPPPARCAAKEDCPPGLPGCPTAGGRGNKGWGESCRTTKECQSGLTCAGGMCEEGEEEGGGPSGPHKKNWVGLYGAFDFAYVAGDDVCGRDSQANKGYACFTTSDNQYESPGTQYHGEPIQSGNGNAIAGGLAPATVRVMLGYDRAFGSHIMLGARLGFAIRGGPQPDSGNAFLPLHAEARAAYWFGQSAFSKTGFRPFGFVAGGMAQVDTKVDVSVREQATCGPDGCIVDDDNDPSDGFVQRNPQSQKVEAWRKAGQSFVGLGGGVMLAFTPNSGVVGEVKFSYMLPTPNIIVSPTLGYVVGF